MELGCWIFGMRSIYGLVEYWTMKRDTTVNTDFNYLRLYITSNDGINDSSMIPAFFDYLRMH